VVVYITEYASKKVAVLGEVPAPGFYVLKEKSTLLSLLSEAGLPLSGSGATIILTRSPDVETLSGEVPAPTVLNLRELVSPWQDQEPVRIEAGDRIFVRFGSGGKVIVSGKVKSPGVLPMSDGLTAIEAINRAGGLAEFGSLKGVRVVREGKTGSEVLTLDLTAVLEGDRSQDVELADGDIVIVPRRWF
jgi:protein involved in polysaccharide export with SLBB domain